MPTIVGGPYLAGVARTDITPKKSVWMSGYADRKHASKGVVHPLWAKVLVIDDGERCVAIVATDLIGLPRTITDAVSERVQKEYGFDRSQILFNSTHTHTGPVVWPNLRAMFALGRKDKRIILDYACKLGEDLFLTIGAALRDRAPASLWYGLGKAHFAMNRREWTPDGVRIGANSAGPVDLDVPVLRILSEDGNLRAVMFGYACHNATLPGDFYQFSGDYAGFAQIELEKRHSGATSMFLMLCGGDQNPHPRGSLELARHYGKTLAAEVDRVLGAALTPLKPPIRTAFGDIHLSFAPHTRQVFEEELKSGDGPRVRRAKAMLRAHDEGKPIRYTSYPIQALRFGLDLTILALGGEVAVTYSLKAKRAYLGNLVVAAYSNDVMSYIPSQRILREGGYEAVESMVFYCQPGAYADDVEDRVNSGIRDVMHRVGLAPQEEAEEREA